ncbi:hypothetical protein GCM10017655_09570 [Pseudomonas turukhanskensis]|uniref:Transposase n=1 Tax=Pseudomonas turukhanskensis TaxID=1806536 RepID=A0A9W6NEN6_9PSED|nr:hypothetical protein GCM10017655_09570 [Pseudomonas turukhanskensis]
MDGKHAIITDSFVTPGNVHDSRPYLARQDRQCERDELTRLALDAGYFSPAICKGLEERNIYGEIGRGLAGIEVGCPACTYAASVAI